MYIKRIKVKLKNKVSSHKCNTVHLHNEIILVNGNCKQELCISGTSHYGNYPIECCDKES